jgi:hypothetical protein
MTKSRAPRSRKIAAPCLAPLFTAAVRYRDGRNELLRIKNALNIDDAREVAMGVLMNVHLLLIAELKVPVAAVSVRAID